MVARAVVVAVGRGVTLAQNIGGLPFSELGPTAGTVVVIPGVTGSFPFPSLEHRSLEKVTLVNTPLLVWVHDGITSPPGVLGNLGR
jgi:hypothetical protein